MGYILDTNVLIFYLYNPEQLSKAAVDIVHNEDTRVKIPATIQLLRLGYEYQSLRDADVDFGTKIFINRFKPALENLNGRAFFYNEIKELLLEIGNIIA